MMSKNQKMRIIESAKSCNRGQSVGYRSGALTGIESQANICYPDRDQMTRSSVSNMQVNATRTAQNFYNSSVLDSSNIKTGI